jgi:hypothetical protein
MPEIFSYPGEVNPTDVKASDPTVLRGGAAALNCALAVTEAVDAGAFAASAFIAAALAKTEGIDTISVSAKVVSAMSCAVTDAPDVLALSAKAIEAASLSVTEVKDAPALSGATVIIGALAAAENKDMGAVQAQALLNSALAATEENHDSAALSAAVIVAAEKVAQELPDQVVFLEEHEAGAEPDVNFVLDVTDAPDNAAIQAIAEAMQQPAPRYAGGYGGVRQIRPQLIKKPSETRLAITETQDSAVMRMDAVRLAVAVVSIQEAKDESAIAILSFDKESVLKFRRRYEQDEITTLLMAA